MPTQRMKTRIPLLIGLFSMLVAGCLNLKSVNTLSTAAIGSLQPNPPLPVTFGSVYGQRIIDDSLSRHPFDRIPVIGINFAGQVGRDSLRSYQLADSLTRSGTDLLVNYFKALAALSDGSSSFRPVQVKSPAFDAFLQQSAVKLTAAETISFNRVLSVVGAAATGAYRKRELLTLLEQSHNDVRQLLGVLIFAHERLATVVSISREQQYGYYKNLLIRDPTLSYLQKQQAAQQWIQSGKTSEQTRRTVLTYIKAIRTVQAGYDELYSNRTRLKRADILTLINGYSTTLQQLSTDLRQLSPVYGRLVP